MTLSINELKKINIKDLQAQIKETRNSNRKDNLKSILKQAKAAQSNKFVTVEDLKEYKGLIIWNIKNASYGFNLVKSVMTEMLRKVDANEVGYVTKRGIKGVITKLANNITLELAETELLNRLGLDVTVNASENQDLANFEQYRINKIK